MSVNRSSFIKWAAAAAVAFGALGAMSTANAGGSVSVGIALPGLVVGIGQPSYYAPAPSYYPPAPVYYPPAPVYYNPPPVYYRPAPVYQAPPPVVYYGDRYYRQDPPRGYGYGNGRGHGRGHDYDDRDDRRDWR